MPKSGELSQRIIEAATRKKIGIPELPIRAPLGYRIAIERDSKGQMTAAVLEPFLIDEQVPKKSEL